CSLYTYTTRFRAQVDIPVPPRNRLNDGETQKDTECALMEMCAQAVRELDRKIRPTISSCDGERNVVAKFLIPRCQEKPPARLQVPVPDTDTGRHEECAKASGRRLVREHGVRT